MFPTALDFVRIMLCILTILRLAAKYLTLVSRHSSTIFADLLTRLSACSAAAGDVEPAQFNTLIPRRSHSFRSIWLVPAVGVTMHFLDSQQIHADSVCHPQLEGYGLTGTVLRLGCGPKFPVELRSRCWRTVLDRADVCRSACVGI